MIRIPFAIILFFFFSLFPSFAFGREGEVDFIDFRIYLKRDLFVTSKVTSNILDITKEKDGFLDLRPKQGTRFLILITKEF